MNFLSKIGLINVIYYFRYFLFTPIFFCYRFYLLFFICLDSFVWIYKVLFNCVTIQKYSDYTGGTDDHGGPLSFRLGPFSPTGSMGHQQ